MAPNHSEDIDAEARKRELMAGLTLVVNFLAAALLTSPRNEYLVELQAKYIECMNTLQAQQNVIEMQQDEMGTLQAGVAELAARYDALLARFAALQAAQAVAPPIDPPAHMHLPHDTEPLVRSNPAGC